MSKINLDHKLDLTPEQLKKIARYEMTFRGILPESGADSVYMLGDTGYFFSLEDLTAALRSLQTVNPTIYDFDEYWLHPILCLSDAFHLNEARGLYIGIDDTPEELRGYDGLFVRDYQYFDDIWTTLSEACVSHGEDMHLADVIAFDEIFSDLARYADNKGKPLEEWVFSEKEMMNYIRSFQEDPRVANASEKELRLCRKMVESLIEADYNLALSIKGYACYGGSRLYDCDWPASRDCITRLYEKTEDPQYANTLGYIYYYGRCTGGIPEYDKAFHFFEIAAANGLYEGMYKLADMYRHGYGCKESPRTASSLYKMVYDNCYAHYMNDEDVPFADAALRMGNVYAGGIGVEQDPRPAYYYYLQADYAARRRAEKSDFFGNAAVVIRIQKAMEKAKAEIHNGYFGRYFDYASPFLFEQLASGRFKCQITRKQKENGEWSLTASRISSRSCPEPEYILVTIPQLELCARTKEAAMTTVDAEDIWFAQDADCIRYDFCCWSNEERHYEFYYDDQLTGWIRCDRFRVFAKTPEPAHGRSFSSPCGQAPENMIE